MNKQKNCWDFTACGREPGGTNVHELGICPAAITKNCHGIHGGVCGGRACWAISGTLCQGKLQGTLASKLKNCMKCAFYQEVLQDESNSGSLLSADQIIALYLAKGSTTSPITNDPTNNSVAALIKTDERLSLHLRDLSALVLDSNPVSRQIVITCLEQQGVTVHSAKDEDEARAIAGQEPTLDLIIAEVHSAEGNGLDLCRYLRRQPGLATTPIILLCPEQYRAQVLVFFQAGATDYIIRPCAREELLARLLIHIESQQRLKELSQEVDKNRLLLDSVGEGVVGIDSSGHVTFVNQAAARMLGHLPSDLLGKDLHRLTHHTTLQGEAYAPSDCPIVQSLADGKIVTNSNDVFWRSDNSSMPVKYISTPITFNDTTYGAVVAFSDITLEKKEAALRQDIEQITRHDLKTPLNGIIGIPSLLLEDNNITERQRLFLEMIKESGYRMLEMINESLNIFKMEKGTYKFCPGRVDLLATIRSIQGELMLLKDKEIEITISIDGRPYAAGQYFMVQGEELLCYSMFANLIKNAAEASPHGGEINISLTRKEPLAVITIHNQGLVPKAIQHKFFEKFSTADKSGGTGLGTYSAKLIAETQKGSISMTSSPEHGTSLTIQLPAITNYL